jgi:putative Holliday junction resolvase
MRLLGVDFGTVRVGLATLDTGVGFALPWKSVDGGPVRETAQRVAAFAAQEGAERIVVGIPVAMDGSHAGDLQAAAQGFAEALRAQTAIAVDTEDERLTSAMVESTRRNAGAGRGQVDKDASAAALILESYAGRMGLVS